MSNEGVGEPPPGGGTNRQQYNSTKNSERKALCYSDKDVGPFQVMVESFNVFKSSVNSANTQNSQSDTTPMNTDNDGTSSETDNDNINSTNAQTNTDNDSTSSGTDNDNIKSTNTQENKTENLHIGSMHPLSIARTILELGVQGVISFEKKGRNRLCITFNSFTAANQFLSNKTLLDKGYSMFVPSNLVSCKGIVRYVDKSFTTEDILKYASAYNIDIIHVKRLDHRVINARGEAEFKPTATVLFTFSGKTLPRFVEICRIPMPVEPYIIPVVQCQKCFLFGHTQKNCKSTPKCKTCTIALNNHRGECSMRCLHCDSVEHNSTAKSCPEFNRQKLIRQIMSLDNLSFFDANLRVPKPRKNTAYFSKAQDFPSLPKSKPNLTIDVSQRRNFISQPSTSYSYTAVARKKRKPSSPTNSTSGYDRAAHNNCLIYPDGREFNLAKPIIDNNSTKPAVDSNATLVAKDSVTSLLYIFNSLTETERELVLNKLGLNFKNQKAITSNADCSSNDHLLVQISP